MLASQQHHFAAAISEGLTDANQATRSSPQTSWWIAGTAFGCAAAVVMLFVAMIGGALIFMPRGQPQFVQPPTQHQRAVELPPFAQLDLPELALPELSWQRKDLTASSLIGSERPPVYKDIAPAGGWLVGLRLTQGPNWGGAIRAIQPIYQVGDAYQLGDRHGLPGGVSQSQLLARPGFAVGEIRVRAGLVMNAIQVTFYRAAATGLDSSDTYESDWVGCPGGHLFEPLRCDGKPLVGISGSYIEDHFGIGVFRAIR